MNTIFMNSENSKISDPYRPSRYLTDKIDLRRKYKYILLYQSLVFIIHGKYKKVI